MKKEKFEKNYKKSIDNPKIQWYNKEKKESEVTKWQYQEKQKEKC